MVAAGVVRQNRSKSREKALRNLNAVPRDLPWNQQDRRFVSRGSCATTRYYSSTTGMTNLSAKQISKVKNKRQLEDSRKRLGKAEMATIVADYLNSRNGSACKRESTADSYEVAEDEEFQSEEGTSNVGVSFQKEDVAGVHCNVIAESNRMLDSLRLMSTGLAERDYHCCMQRSPSQVKSLIT